MDRDAVPTGPGTGSEPDGAIPGVVPGEGRGLEAPVLGSGTGRFEELDALRGLAALAVLGFHYFVLYPKLFDPTIPIPPLIVYGEYGVELFFIISGFVILLTVERTPGVRRFAFARFSRLYPVYWAALALTFVIVRVWPVPGGTGSIRDGLVNLTMLGGFFGVPYVDTAYWSLTVELGFYAVVAVLLAARRTNRALEVVFAIAVAYALVNVVNQVESTEWLQVPIEAHLRFIRYAHLFAAGIACYLYLVKGRRNPLVYAAVILTPVIALIDGGVVSGVVVGVVVVVFVAGALLRPAFLRWRPFLFLGGVSYALYLVHQHIGYVIIRALGQRGVDHWVAIAVATGASIALATALTYAVERPARAALRRLRSGT